MNTQISTATTLNFSNSLQSLGKYDELSTSAAKFSDRVKKAPLQVQEFYGQILQHLMSFENVKARSGVRCENFRIPHKLIAKIAIGGKTLKLFLPLSKDDEKVAKINVCAKNLSATKAYEQVPFQIPLRSRLAVEKACIVITDMMRNLGIAKKITTV